MSSQTLNKIPEPVQNKQENQGSIILIGGVHLNTDVKTTVHSNSNEFRKSAQKKRNMARYSPGAFFFFFWGDHWVFLGINNIEVYLKKNSCEFQVDIFGRFRCLYYI